jgi:hypothetical protein
VSSELERATDLEELTLTPSGPEDLDRLRQALPTTKVQLAPRFTFRWEQVIEIVDQQPRFAIALSLADHWDLGTNYDAADRLRD